MAGQPQAAAFVEREPWERGFAQIYATDISPQLARLEWQRRLTLVAIVICGLASICLAAILLPHLPWSAGRGARGEGFLLGLVIALPLALAAGLAVRFRQREEAVFLPAVCRQFAGLEVEVAPKGATIAALDPYWRLGLLHEPKNHSSVTLQVYALFKAARRGGIDLSLVDIGVWPRNDFQFRFRGSVVELALPDPGAGHRYAEWRFTQSDLPHLEAGETPSGFATGRVIEALRALASAFQAEAMAGAVADGKLYIAVPSTKQNRRHARHGIMRRADRCEPAIRAALVELAMALALADAVADACAAAPIAVAAPDGAAEPGAVGGPVAELVGTIAAMRAGGAGSGAAWRTSFPGVRGGVLLAGLGLAIVVAGVVKGVVTTLQTDPAVDGRLRAAQNGDAQAQNEMGWRYWYGRGVARDDWAALSWYRKAADQGYAPAENNVGLLYEYGQVVAQDYRQAGEWYRRAADQGFAPAENNLGLLYEQGHGVAQDYATAAALYRKAAEQGSLPAQDNLGLLYSNGNGVTKDFSQAVYWMRRAADRGYAPAQNNLGYAYENGQGLAQDYAQAMAWYQKAAAQHLAHAEYHVGALYAVGKGVAVDRGMARGWMQQAAAAGDQSAKEWLAANRPIVDSH